MVMINPNANKNDMTSGGKYRFEKKSRKINITIPLEPWTIERVGKTASDYGMSKSELLRNMIEFASRNIQFKGLMDQLYGSQKTR